MHNAVTLLRRAVRGLVSVGVTFVISFLAMAFIKNPNAGTLGYTPQSISSTYQEPRFATQSEPLFFQLVEWTGRVLTLDLGTLETNAGMVSISSVIMDSIVVTLIYLLPATIIAVNAGTLIQLLAVSVERRDLSKKMTLLGAAAVATPVFLFAFLFHAFLPEFLFELTGTFPDLGYDSDKGPFSVRNLRASLWPFLTMTFYLFAIQFRTAGTELEQYADEPFVKTARAKGVGLLGVCRHVFPNSAARLLTLLSSEMLSVVLVGLYAVEWVTETPGFGTLTIDAVGSRYPGLVFGVVLLPVGLLVTVNFLQDAYYELIDPRVDPVS